MQVVPGISQVVASLACFARESLKQFRLVRIQMKPQTLIKPIDPGCLSKACVTSDCDQERADADLSSGVSDADVQWYFEV